jgi:hypothetical protein
VVRHWQVPDMILAGGTSAAMLVLAVTSDCPSDTLSS